MDSDISVWSQAALGPPIPSVRDRRRPHESHVAPLGRDRFDDADRVERGLLCYERGLPARWCVKDEEADLVFGNVDRVVEADVRPALRQLLGSRARPPLARRTLACSAAREEGLDEVARHAFDATAAPTPWKRQNF